MINFIEDTDVDSLGSVAGLPGLMRLLGSLCGQQIPQMSTDTDKERRAIIQEILKSGKRTPVRLTYEQFNEILLLLNQYRVEKPFFDFFILDKEIEWNEAVNLAAKKDANGNPIENVSLVDLKKGVRKFRGFAMLCFGNFRFAFRKLSSAKSVKELVDLMTPWIRCPVMESGASRPEPVVSIDLANTKIPKSETWHLGYLTTGAVFSDIGLLHALDGHVSGESLSQRKAKIEDAEIKKRIDYHWSQITQQQKQEWSSKLQNLIKRSHSLHKRIQSNREKGKKNTVKYLTWDFLDVYVATSMREQWEFHDTYEAVDEIFKQEELKDLGLRWFDPTQSYEESVVDKGLLEGLMLKRARCTIYMVQEGETLGKDSELAATLAQGKPVIAYVPQVTEADLQTLSKRLKERSLRYFRKRILVLKAEGFFEKPENLSKAKGRLDKISYVRESATIESEADDILLKLGDFKPTFALISQEEEKFKRAHQSLIERAAKFLAAIESVAADNRADTIKVMHPLAMQVDLDTGVANGVLVARNVKECAVLIKDIITNDLQFKIAKLEDKGRSLGTTLLECSTSSRFRVVTNNETLTNSFWNFYLKD